MTSSIILSWIASALTSITLVPQCYKIIKIRDTKAISLFMFLIFFASGICWTIYGFITKQPPIIVTNSLITLFSIAILSYKTYNIFKKGERP